MVLVSDAAKWTIGRILVTRKGLTFQVRRQGIKVMGEDVLFQDIMAPNS